MRPRRADNDRMADASKLRIAARATASKAAQAATVRAFPHPHRPGNPASDTVTPAGQVLRVLRRIGPATRSELSRQTGFSLSAVNRVVGELLGCALLRDRPELTVGGAVGRPQIPLDLNTEAYFTVGVHVDEGRLRCVAGDLRGRALDRLALDVPDTAQEALPVVGSALRRFRLAFPARCALWVGIVGDGRSDRRADRGSGPDWRDVADGAWPAAIPVPVTIAPHVETMAATELQALELTGRPGPSSYLYLHVDEPFGAAWIVDGRIPVPRSGAGTIGHLATGSDVPCPCGRVGCLEVTVADRTLLATAVRDGALGPDAASRGIGALYAAAAAGAGHAAALLDSRADVVGRAVAMMRDIVNPDVVAVGGRGLVAYRPGREVLARSYARASALPPLPLTFSSFGERIGDAGALGASLSTVYTDPLGALRRRAARPSYDPAADRFCG